MQNDERMDILNGDGLHILQKRHSFRFGTDSILLADFAVVKPGARVVDLGAGTGVISILLAAKHENARFVAIEIQQDMADMAGRSVEMNGLGNRIEVLQMDMRCAAREIGFGNHSLVVCNPPYGKLNGTLVSERPEEYIARHEGSLTICHVAESAAALLKNGGRIALIFPAPRLFELMEALRANDLEPKRIRTVHAMADRAPKRILLDAVKGGGSQLHWMPPLVLSNADGTPSAEWRRIYREDSS